MLSFGYSMKIILIIHWWFCCSQVVKDFLASHALPCAQKAGMEESQDSWPKQAKGVFLTVWCHAQYISCSWPRGKYCCSGVNKLLVSWQQLHCVSLFCKHSSYYYYCYYYCCCLCYFLFLSCSIKLFITQVMRLFITLSDSLPHPTSGGGTWVSGCVVLVASWG